MVYADIVISPTYSQRHTLFICSGCLCLVRPDRDACVTMCCAKPMHLRCYRTDPCTACLTRINGQLFYICGERSLNHAPTAPSYSPFHPVYYPVTDPRYFHGKDRMTARPYFLAVRSAPNGPVFFNWILKAFRDFCYSTTLSVWHHIFFVKRLCIRMFSMFTSRYLCFIIIRYVSAPSLCLIT